MKHFKVTITVIGSIVFGLALYYLVINLNLQNNIVIVSSTYCKKDQCNNTREVFWKRKYLFQIRNPFDQALLKDELIFRADCKKDLN